MDVYWKHLVQPIDVFDEESRVHTTYSRYLLKYVGT